jgi:hypothetical protein
MDQEEPIVDRRLRDRPTAQERQYWVLSLVIAFGLTNVVLTILSLWFPLSPVTPRLSVLCVTLGESAPKLVESGPVTVPSPTFESLNESLLDHPLLDLAATDQAIISVEISNDGLRTTTLTLQNRSSCVAACSAVAFEAIIMGGNCWGYWTNEVGDRR